MRRRLRCEGREARRRFLAMRESRALSRQSSNILHLDALAVLVDVCSRGGAGEWDVVLFLRLVWVEQLAVAGSVK